MFSICAEQMQTLAQAQSRRQEAPWLERELRQTYGLALQGMSDESLRKEIHACLARCDELGLSRTADRLILCMLDIVGFPGLRDLPQLPALLARHAEAKESALLDLMLEAPAEFWVWLLDRSQVLRRERGMP